MEFRTTGFNGYAVKYSPYFDNRLAVAASANYGLVGNGRLFVLGLDASGIHAEKVYETSDSVYDLAWAESSETQVILAGGDGSIKLFDIAAPGNNPVAQWQEHNREVYAVAYNLVTKDSFVSSSWDGTVKVWSPIRSQSMLTLPTHSCTYSAAFAPRSASIVSCVSSDSHLRIYDLRTPASATNHLVHLIPAHGHAPVPGGPQRPSYEPAEILTHDWNKYRDTVIATAGVDQLIRTFDIRNPKGGPVAILRGHNFAVRKIAWSPHLSDVLISGSYDMTARVWTDGSTSATPSRPITLGPEAWGDEYGRFNAHTEFVTGVDWCLFGTEGWVATTAWDERVCVWDVRTVMGQNRTRFHTP
ncbi:WD40 repeat-like protein [Mollisia scopiformis]|uniref:Peroxin-7 n=1 Tax=Mollisia scopiformis TaxID=149040 RepID=A0A194XAH4_MOLSC|nr:WD40 repeat-like protein [Mollisia scopiformis]KUJ17173.1 WD40 repeat-like protein [Mollisia scopiformis]